MCAVRCLSYARFLPGFDEEAGVVPLRGTLYWPVRRLLWRTPRVSGIRSPAWGFHRFARSRCRLLRSSSIVITGLRAGGTPMRSSSPTFTAFVRTMSGYYLLPFAAGNFLGPVLIGRLFDTRRLPEECTTIHVQGARGRPETRVRANRRSGRQTKPQTVQAPHYQQKDNERHCAH